MRAESRHETDFGFAEPRARVEYRRELGGRSAVNLWYSDLPGEVYSVTPSGTSRNSLLLGVGADLVMGGGLKVGLDYLAQRSAGASNTQGVLYEKFESDHRTGPRYFVGFNARRALTDRIELFAELGHNWRYGNSDVFDWRDYAAKLNIDYALGRKGILYLTGEYRRGDSVSSGPPSLAVGAADVFVPDDAFENQGFIAYRIDGTRLRRLAEGRR